MNDLFIAGLFIVTLSLMVINYVKMHIIGKQVTNLFEILKAEEFIASVDSFNRVTIPKRYRVQFNINHGDYLKLKAVKLNVIECDKK